MLKKRIKRIIIVVVIITVIIAIYFAMLNRDSSIEYTTAKIERDKLVQTVSETGMVKAASEIDLNFLNSGNVARILVKTGDNVKNGQVLAELDYSSLSIKEKEAQANLNKIIKGATSAGIAVKQASVNQTNAAYLSAINELEKTQNTVSENIIQAEKTLSDLESSLPSDVTTYEQAVKVARTTLDNTKKTYQQSINNEEDDILIIIKSELNDANTALDTINTVITDTDASDVLSIKNPSYLISTKNSRIGAIAFIDIANSSLSTAKFDKTEININEAISDTKNVLNKTFDSLNNCFKVLENTITNSSFTQTNLDTFKSSVSAKLIVISTSISNVQTAEQDLENARLNYNTNVSDKEVALTKTQVDLDNAIINARNSLNSAQISGDQQVTIAQAKVDNTKEALEVAKAQLAEIKAPARSEDIVLYQAALDSARKQIEDSIIKAPIDGTITKINYEIGEQTSAGKQAISILGVNNFEIEVDISETDIAKVNIGNLVEITLDAFGDDIKFSGIVFFLEPAETVIQDVIYYKTVIELSDNSIYRQYFLNIKSGMTANIVITTMQKENVLIVPNRAIVQKNGQGKHVRVLVNGMIEEMTVVTGLRGDEGMVEVLSGVSEGDEVVTFIKEKK